jgi:hypothetical protein
MLRGFLFRVRITEDEKEEEVWAILRLTLIRVTPLRR